MKLCVETREKNKAVKRERQTVPTIDELILNLNDIKLLSKRFHFSELISHRMEFHLLCKGQGCL